MRRNGFTLLEVLIVIAILAMIAALAWPEYESYLHSADLPQSASRMESMIAMTRAEAMNQARRYRLRIFGDGTVDLTRQLDPLLGPHLYTEVRTDWARTKLLLGDVWIRSVLSLPDGPPPISVEDDELDLTKFDVEDASLVTDLERPVEIWFEPDGTCSSARWTLRDARGRGLRLTLDGRLGRVKIEDAERLEPTEVERPDLLTLEDKQRDLVLNPAERLDELRQEQTGPR